jgi:hypothetical protein
MSDAVATLSTTLQGQLAGSGATAPTLLALSSAIVSGAQAMVAARQARRVALLAAVLVPALLPVNTNVGTIAMAWNEVQEARAFLAGAQNLDSQLNGFRAMDSRGVPSTTYIANIPFANYATWGNALITSAAAFEALELETLPA